MEPDDDVKRLAAFCDAVMAIAMTLLVLDLDKPDPKAITSTAQLHDALDQWSAYASFALSWVIAIYWRVHFRAFRRFRRVDGTVLQLTLLFLFGITFLPFPTAILHDFPRIVWRCSSTRALWRQSGIAGRRSVLLGAQRASGAARRGWIGANGSGTLPDPSLDFRPFVLCCLDRSRSGTLGLAAAANLWSFPPDHLQESGVTP